MKTRTILLSALILAALTGCEHIRHIGLRSGPVSIEAGTRSGDGGGSPKHCPPGHAKKRQC